MHEWRGHWQGPMPPWAPDMACGPRRRRGGPPPPPPPGPPGFPPGPPPWVREWMGMRFRPERGEVRFLVLDALADGPSHGYEIIQKIEQKTEGTYRPSPGSIYPTLQMLEEMDLVTSEDVGKRKRYELTDAGREELAAHADEVAEAYDRFGGGTAEWFEGLDFRGWRRRLKGVMRIVGREARRGRLDRKQLGKIKDIVDDAIDRIEAILAGDR